MRLIYTKTYLENAEAGCRGSRAGRTRGTRYAAPQNPVRDVAPVARRSASTVGSTRSPHRQRIDAVPPSVGPIHPLPPPSGGGKAGVSIRGLRRPGKPADSPSVFEMESLQHMGPTPCCPASHRKDEIEPPVPGFSDRSEPSDPSRPGPSRSAKCSRNQLPVR